MGLLKEWYRRAVVYRHRPGHWRLRPGTIDRRLFRSVAVENEYQLPGRFPEGSVLLDVGGHVGSFSYAALRRGAGFVYCCEPNPDNLDILHHNLSPYLERVELIPCAVWRSDRAELRLSFDNPEPRNTGAGHVRAGGSGPAVPALAFDDLVLTASAGGSRRVHLVKLDCEGAEWPILLTSRTLHLVDGVCGEYHLRDYSEPYTVDGWGPYTPELLLRFFKDQGFAARTQPHPEDPRFGLFFATRARW
jgi:FkbM family methyltransferase